MTATHERTVEPAVQPLWIAGVIVSLALVTYSASIAWAHAGRTRETAAWVARTHHIDHELTRLLAAITDIEDGMRGYVISGESRYLEPYRAGLEQFDSKPRITDDLVTDEETRADMEALVPLIDRRIAIARRLVEIRQNFGFEAARAAIVAGQGLSDMGEIRTAIARLHDRERALLEQRKRTAEHEARIVPLLIVASSALGGALFMLLFYLAARENFLRQRADEALRLTGRRLDLALESGHMGVWEMDLVNGTVWRSREHDRIYGYDTLLPHWELATFLKHVAPSDQERVMACFEEAQRTDRLTLECEITRTDNERRWIYAAGTVYRDEGGRPVRMLGTIADITERKRTEAELSRQAQALRAAEQLRAANAELEAFCYTVSHDLRAPLRHIQGYVELLNRETEAAPLSDTAQRYLRTIADVSAEMGDLIDDLLAFSRMGKVDLQQSRIPLEELVRGVIGTFDAATQGRRIEWRIGAMPAVFGDPSALKQVFANLVGNAVKYTRPRDPARIEIGCCGEEEGRVILFVRDNGVGFDMQYAHKLFGVFQRLHRAKDFEGTGIGLAIVRRIIGRHDGRVWAEAALDRGAAFYFTLQPAPAAIQATTRGAVHELA